MTLELLAIKTKFLYDKNKYKKLYKQYTKQYSIEELALFRLFYEMLKEEFDTFSDSKDMLGKTINFLKEELKGETNGI